MRSNWYAYISNQRTDAGRALVEQGTRIAEARQNVTETKFLEILRKVGITPRDARVLEHIGRRVSPLLETHPTIRLPYRIRTLYALADLSTESLSQAADDKIIHPAMTDTQTKILRNAQPNSISPVIKSTDNWNFNKVQWPRIDEDDGFGYIPGEIYANCLWYYAREGDTVVDPMAGSGMLLRVWEDRDSWFKDNPYSINVIMSDLMPRGPYQEQITQCDLLDQQPTEQSDYIIIDPPYCGLVGGQYSNLPNDLANMTPDDWVNSMQQIAQQFRTTQAHGGRCTIIVPNSRTMTTGERLLFPEIIRRTFQQTGYQLYDVAYASRRTQQRQGRRMGILNNVARRTKVPMSDISEVLTFIAI